MKIAVDAMGGDNAPDAIIEGIIKSSHNYNDLYLTLVGNSDIINQKLKGFDYSEERIEVVEASEIIGMNESPSSALRKKKKSSIAVGCKLVKKGEAHAFVSAGNTGAVMAAGIFHVGRLSGIKRPSIATIFPSGETETLLMDAGANVDSKPEHLLHFAIMGQIYARNVLKISAPRVGLLSIGEEKKKGNQLTASTYELLQEDQRINNFVGNVEGRDIFNGNCDVVICDGFVGNIVLKTTEGVASLLFEMLENILKKNLLTKGAALLIKPYLKELMQKVDYRQYGGAPLLGVDGGVIISHGSSDATAINNAIRVAKETINTDVVNLIEAEVNKG